MILHDFQELQQKFKDERTLLMKVQRENNEKDLKIAELEMKLSEFQKNLPETPYKTPSKQGSLCSNHDQAIEFIEYGVGKIVLPEENNTKPVENEEKEIKKLKLDDSLWLVSKEKEINMEFLDKPAGFIFMIKKYLLYEKLPQRNFLLYFQKASKFMYKDNKNLGLKKNKLQIWCQKD